jgi:hypothetical protein
MGLLEFTKDVRYRIRIFDNGNFIQSAEVPDKGQRSIKMTVHKEWFGLGEKTKLEFMINPEIKPKVFQGKIMEIDFDIRDSVQLADLLDIAPDLVYSINEKYRNKKGMEREREQVINAEFDIKDALEGDDKKSNPLSDTITKIPQEEEDEEDDRAIDTLIRGAKAVGEILPNIPLIGRISTVPENKKEQNIQKCLELCAQHPKLLYWLPKYLKIEPEIHAIVSQSRIYRTGIMPSYYFAQSGAQIAEKVLARPKEQTGWQQVALIGIVVLAVIIVFGLMVWLLKG